MKALCSWKYLLFSSVVDFPFGWLVYFEAFSLFVVQFLSLSFLRGYGFSVQFLGFCSYLPFLGICQLIKVLYVSHMFLFSEVVELIA